MDRGEGVFSNISTGIGASDSFGATARPCAVECMARASLTSDQPRKLADATTCGPCVSGTVFVNARSTSKPNAGEDGDFLGEDGGEALSKGNDGKTAQLKAP